MSENKEVIQESSLDKPKNYLSSSKRLMKVLFESKLSVIIILVSAIFYSILTVIAPMITSDIIDSLLQMTLGNSNSGISSVLAFAGKGILWVLIVYLLTSACSFLQEYYVAGLSEDVTLSLRVKVSKKINKVPLRFFDNSSTGEVLSRVTNDLDRVSEAISISAVQFITSVFTVIGSIIMMARMNLLLSAIALFFIVLSMLTTKYVAQKNLEYSAVRQQKMGELNSAIEENYTGRIIIKAFNREERSNAKIKDYNSNLYQANLNAEFMMHAINPIIRFINRVGYVIISMLSGYLFIQGVITVGNIQAFIIYINQLTEPLAQAAFAINSFQSALASAERIFEILDETEELPEVINPQEITDIQGHVTFENVAFGYGKTNLMNNINIDIKPGQMVAIVGPTGAGKTTLVNILMRFYEINQGAIRIDGINITEFKRSYLRKLFGMVLQDAWLFEGTIAENITYGKPDSSKEEIVDVARAAKADFFIRTLPNSYDSILGDGAETLSLGQKQLLTIARAMIANPPILILDEATSSVDTRTELAIQHAMNELMKNRTSLVIAHRLSTIVNADQILVMNHGDIVEQGTHNELLKRNGFYASLYNSQFAD